MASEKLKAFRDARKIAEAKTISQLGERARDAKQKQDAEWAIREAAIKAGEEQRLKDLKAKEQAEMAIAAKKHQIRMREARAAAIREIEAARQAQEKAIAEMKKEKEKQLSTEKAIEAARIQAIQDEVLKHPEYENQPAGVKGILEKLSHSDAIDCLNNPAMLLSLQRAVFRKMKQ